jgi:large subunit ribosomal protein L17
MRHSQKGRKLWRTSTHRKATMNSLATSLIKHKKVRTTVAKAKEMRLYVEPLITSAKKANALTGDDATITAKRVHARRMVGRFIKDNDALKTLFTEIAPKVADRPGGYTRVVKLGKRLGDAAEMAVIELVDWNDVGAKKPKLSKPRPTRRKVAPAAPASTPAVIVGESVENAVPPPAEAPGEEAPAEDSK